MNYFAICILHTILILPNPKMYEAGCEYGFICKVISCPKFIWFQHYI